MDHCEDAALYLLDLLEVDITGSSLQKDLTAHSNYPSLLAISDVFKTYGIESLSLKLERANWNGVLEPPFLVHINSQDSRHHVFAVVKHFSETEVVLYNPQDRKVMRIDNDDFVKNHYRGTVMDVGVSETAGEKDYSKKIKMERRNSLFHLFAISFLPIITIGCSVLFILTHPIAAGIQLTIFSLLTLLGVIITTLLLWHEIDEHNPAVRQVCQVNKKVNCSAVLDSGASTIFGISWSNIGFTYFVGMLLSLLFGGLLSLPIISIMSWMNILTLPYVAFSVYYQWKIARQWCLLCLSVQAVFVLQFFTSLAGNLANFAKFTEIQLQVHLFVAVLFAILFIGVRIAVPALKNAKESRLKIIELQKVKNNPEIFRSMLERQRMIQPPTPGLGISLGNPNGKHKIIKVCNPYCGPCAEAHPTLEALLEYNDQIDLQIIFTATNNENDYKRDPVRHMLAIASNDDEIITTKALHDWYNAPIKDYNEFANKYPINGELERQYEKIEAMDEWCNLTKVDFTPTFFINGYQLPKAYSIEDLKYTLMA